MESLSQKVIATALESTKFASNALPHRDHSSFELGEMDYKRRLAWKLAAALKACERNAENWRELLAAAIRTKENNIVPWQPVDSFRTWVLDKSSSARRLLLSLNDQNKSPAERMALFSKGMEASGIPRLAQPGAQLALGSIILMAGDPENCPPTRTDVVQFAVDELGLEWSVNKATAPERYQCFLSILDGLIRHSKSGPVVLDNRLEAQGVVWCQKSGWMEKADRIEEHLDAEADITAAEKSLARLTSTEREAVVLARRGQGRFRRSLLTRWLCCAVTNCSQADILRASHLKPWRESNNTERLSPGNGLLLSPTLDALLDAFLISFSASGRILMSKSLSGEDQVALGINLQMALRKTFPDMEPFLRHHRSEFQRLEREER